jgi:DNA replicative helicase MCM subunit Mcm2 (Cdc46/Mcm family)
MAATIKSVFTKTIHRLCRWHMMKYKEELQKLYKVHEGLKEKLRIVINNPLTPEEFEAAWNSLVDEYGICENVAIDGLWKQRELWIVAYFKKYYCGRMTSTQRSESVNKMVKGNGFVTHMTSLHIFARKLLQVIQHTNHNSAGETHWPQVQTRSSINLYG